MDREAWHAAVHGVTKSWTRLSDFIFQFSLSCIGEGSGNPLQYSCLENLMDRGARSATVHQVTKSQVAKSRTPTSLSLSPYLQKQSPLRGALP